MVHPFENLRKRKPTGGRRAPYRSRRRHERDGYALEPLQGEDVVVTRQTRGGAPKWGLRSAAFANVLDPATHKAQRVKILRVVANPANRDYERRRVITKGAVIETELGRARVHSRPAQDAMVNAILLK